jgi:hypothetical protein
LDDVSSTLQTRLQDMLHSALYLQRITNCLVQRHRRPSAQAASNAASSSSARANSMMPSCCNERRILPTDRLHWSMASIHGQSTNTTSDSFFDKQSDGAIRLRQCQHRPCSHATAPGRCSASPPPATDRPRRQLLMRLRLVARTAESEGHDPNDRGRQTPAGAVPYQPLAETQGTNADDVYPA